MKHYIIQDHGNDEYFVFNRARPETDRAKLNKFGLLKWTAEFARLGYLVSYVDMKTMEERTVCNQAPEHKKELTEVKVGKTYIYSDEIDKFPVKITGISSHPNSKGYFCGSPTTPYGQDICAPAKFFSEEK